MVRIYHAQARSLLLASPIRRAHRVAAKEFENSRPLPVEPRAFFRRQNFQTGVWLITEFQSVPARSLPLWGAGGREFTSRRPDQLIKDLAQCRVGKCREFLNEFENSESFCAGTIGSATGRRIWTFPTNSGLLTHDLCIRFAS